LGHIPPVAVLSLTFAAGAAWVLVGVPLGMAPLVALALLFAPNRASPSPTGRRALWVLAGAAGLVSALSLGAGTTVCSPARLGGPDVVEGRFLASPRSGSAPFVTKAGCAPFTVVMGDAPAPAGRSLRLEGVWKEGRYQPWFLAGELSATTDPSDEQFRWRAVRWREGLVTRLDRLYGERAPLVAALVLARREGLDPELRETFARVGIAHLLAISGFHVGVIAGVILVFLLLLGQHGPRAAMGAAVGAWLYVGFIGFPDAACRAALILTAAALSRVRRRPPARWGALGAAFLMLLVLDPSRLASPGFQLSFGGAAGLTAWSAPMARGIQGLTRRRCPQGLATALGAGLAATLATLPVVAWHFERVSLVGIPLTLVAAPLVTLGLIGALASLMVDFVSSGLASILAGGVTSVVSLLEALAGGAGALPWASVWTTRGTVVGAVTGLAAARLLARRPRVGAKARRSMTVLYVSVGVLAWPLLVTLQGRGTVEILMIDVGQGDAIALRSPRGRWILVDTGPAGEDDGAGHPVVRALKSRGVQRLEALVLTHPDLDHIGGASAVLEAFDVGTVYDPGLPAGKQAFVQVLRAAAGRGVPWRAARAGDRIQLDGLDLKVLSPSEELAAGGESNASSVVLHAVFGDFDVLLTGDAYKDVDRQIAPGFTDVVEVLKVGHHGSDTSTDSLLLASASPEVALISVGRYNRYGHPAPEVLGRLQRSGVRVRRTDREGTISVLGRPDGTYSITSRR
jgi:competence protein ComEC